jgi:RNA polymerase sigma factor (sigma-70 family)
MEPEPSPGTAAVAVEAISDLEGGGLRHRVSEHLEVLSVYQRYRGMLEGLCLRSGVRPQDVDDVVQETVTVVLDGYVRKRVGSIGGWLFGVLKKQVSNYHRRRKRLDSRFVPLDYLEPEVESRRAWLSEHGTRSISRVDLRAALLALPARPRLLIVLNAQGRSPREMAQAVGVSPNSVRCLYLRAVKRMRQQLRPDDHYR